MTSLRVALCLTLLAGLALAADPTGSLSVARYSHSATRLADGRVLVAGGHTISGSLSSMTRSVEVYDPATQVFATTGLLTTARGEHGAALLADGRVLVVGGLGNVAGSAVTLSSAEVYDPAMGTWTTTSPMTLARRAPVAVTLLDGRVLVIAGGGTATCELFDPVTNTFTATGAMSAARQRPAVARLSDGRVLVAGGLAGSYLATTELFDPATGTWSAGPSLATARAYATATLLNDGRVLVAGGMNSSAVGTAELLNATATAFSPAGALTVARHSHAAALLASGDVVIAGGTNASWVIDGTVEVYDVAAGAFRSAGLLTAARNSHTATALGNGKALIAGGLPVTSSANLFDPACASPAVLSPATLSFGADGVTASVTVSKSAACAWSVTSAPSWVTVTSGAGVGDGTISFTVASNRGSASSRSGLLRVSDASASLTQASDPCLTGVTSLSPGSASFASAGGQGSVTVTPPAGCAWSVSSVPSWVSVVSGAPGTGPGTLTFDVASNPGTARSATLRIATANFVVSQAANACVATISPASQSVASSGGSGSVSVSTGAGCGWTTSGAPSWVTVTSGQSGSGAGTVTFSVAANSGAARNASLLVAGNTFTLSQAAGSSSCTVVSTLSPGTSFAGTLAAGDCTAGARGASYLTDRYTFNGAPGQQVAFVLTSTGFDTYLYLKNPSGTVIASNDDGGGGTNSRIPATSGVFTLPAGVSGTYTIEVTSYSAGATGAYTLQRIQ